jgi:hypothetical protein
MSKHSKKFRSAEEMGRELDGHEVSDDTSTPVEVLVDKRYDPTLTMRIPEEDLRKLKELADARGVPAATMGRMLLLERLRTEGQPHAEARRVLETIGGDESLRQTLRNMLRGHVLKIAGRSHPGAKTQRRATKKLSAGIR